MLFHGQASIAVRGPDIGRHKQFYGRFIIALHSKA